MNCEQDRQRKTYSTCFHSWKENKRSILWNCEMGEWTLLMGMGKGEGTELNKGELYGLERVVGKIKAVGLRPGAVWVDH
jgi:hypothetical protein